MKISCPALIALAAAALAYAAPLAHADTPAPAELVLVHGKIWTGAADARDAKEVEALAVSGGRIVAVGSSAQLKSLIGKQTRILELGGRRVVPGFHDSHVHLLDGGLGLSRIALKDAADEAEFGKRLRELDRKLPPGRWILGGDWDHDQAFKGELPTAALIDRYVSNRPVYITRYDGHMAVVNTRVLTLAGINAKTADPPGGVVYRKAGTREPTGLLRDNAMGLADDKVPPLTDEEIAEAVQAALGEAKRLGVTSVEDMAGAGPDAMRRLFREYQRLARAGELSLRIQLYWPITRYKELAALGFQSGLGGDFVRIGGVKGFIDGSIGSSTAKLFAPYLNEPGSTGIYVTAPGELRELVRGADAAGLAVAVHAIGDRANAELLDLFADVIKQNGARDRRFRIEHAQHLRPEDYRRFKDLDVVASMQPYHAIDDGRFVEGRIGAARCASSYAWRSLLDAGATLAFGSDWAVAPLSALEGIDAAVHRITPDGKRPGGWFPAERISVAEALAAYTRGAAFAAHRERDEGTLEPGKLADLVVLSRDILSPGEKSHIAETRVLTTIVGGRIVYEAKPAEK